jgi:hypothetical protein
MSFTRRMKYNQIITTRKLKNSVSSERLEVAGFLFIAVISLFAMNVALMGL